MSLRRLVLVTPEVVDHIVGIGLERSPQEACGLVLPPGKVVELRNVCPTPRKSYLVDNGELEQVLTKFIDDTRAFDLHPSDFLVWHTHPRGTIGPSEGDLEARQEGFKYLVVSLPDGEAVRF